MPPIKKKYKTEAKETRSKEEIAIQSIVNSQYHLMIPMYEAKYVKVKNPITGLHDHFSTDDENFFALLHELSKKGLQQKILNDLEYFAEHYDANWHSIKDAFLGYFKVKETLQ